MSSSPPRRRSARIRGSSGSPVKVNTFNTSSCSREFLILTIALYQLRTPRHQNQLSSLTERDETPIEKIQTSLDTIISSPSAPHTPQTAGRAKPSREQMHPSMAQQSTAKKIDEGLQFGFADIKESENPHTAVVAQGTPSKTSISSPTFDFHFARPAPELGPEAQKMMDELREEALRIKAKLAAEREQAQLNGEEDPLNSYGRRSSRKIAQAKGKVSRYSDVHMAQFKKMDSIANHPSAYRAQPNRMAPAATSLKRSQSKAKLDEPESSSGKTKPTGTAQHSDRLENTAPAKRARQNKDDDASTARPVSQDGNKTVSGPNASRPRNTFLEAISTPTKASLARSASIKNLGSQTAIVPRSASTKALVNTPKGMARSKTTQNLSQIPQSESTNKFTTSPSKLDRIKSILRRPDASPQKNAPVQQTLIPTLIKTPNKPKLDKELPATPGAQEPPKSIRRVNFTPTTISKHNASNNHSPSPLKSGIPRSVTKPLDSSVSYPKLGEPSSSGKVVDYPDLSSSRLPQPSFKQPEQEQKAPDPRMFTFRAEKTTSFGPSPGQATIRAVRPSVFPSEMPGTFPATENKENTPSAPTVPHGAYAHGMSNKKRRRVESDDETEDEILEEHSPKKQKLRAQEGQKLVSDLQSKILPQNRAVVKYGSPSKSQSPAKRMLSKARLNMLARPKNRK